ncbi:MAG: hypothetical protein V1802_00970 [Candidatus Aenigmatarchaeota archaeon]
MPIRKILKIRKSVDNHVKDKMKEFEKKLNRRRRMELGTEILIAAIFAIISGWYIYDKYGLEKLEDTLMSWMFPASIMILLTLISIWIIESMKRYK